MHNPTAEAFRLSVHSRVAIQQLRVRHPVIADGVRVSRPAHVGVARNAIKRPLTRMPDEEIIYRFQLSRVLPAGTDTASMIALNRTLYERARDIAAALRDIERSCDVAGRLEAPLRTCLADCPGSEDEVRPEEVLESFAGFTAERSVIHHQAGRGVSVAQASRDLRVHERMREWLSAFATDPEQAFPGRGQRFIAMSMSAIESGRNPSCDHRGRYTRHLFAFEYPHRFADQSIFHWGKAGLRGKVMTSPRRNDSRYFAFPLAALGAWIAW